MPRGLPAGADADKRRSGGPLKAMASGAAGQLDGLPPRQRKKPAKAR